MSRFLTFIVCCPLLLLQLGFLTANVQAQISTFYGSDKRSEKNPDKVLGSTEHDSFRINNKVFIGKDKVPAVQSCTMFHLGKVYDFLTAPDETIIYDPEQQRFLLLCRVTQSQCSLTLDEVREFGRMMKETIPRIKDEFLLACLNPQFEITTDEKTDELVFTQSKLVYRVTSCREKFEGMAKIYLDFANNYALLNVLLSPQNIPPFARIVVNDTLAEKKELPEKVEVTIKRRMYNPLTSTHGQEIIRTEHNFMTGLGDADLAKIRRAGESFGKFKQVGFIEYQRLLKEYTNGGSKNDSSQK